MKKAFSLFVFLLFFISGHAQELKADTNRLAKSKPEKVLVGIYVTSIHDIDFKAKEYEIHFWIWLRYKNRNFDFGRFLEIPNAKTFTKLLDSTYIAHDSVFLQMKVQCTMKDSWKVSNYPFDRQTLRISFENSQFNSDSLLFVEDTVGEHYDSIAASKGRVLNGWNIDSLTIRTGKKEYQTNFGNAAISQAKESYSTFRLRINISRPVWGLFLKTFLGMYIAFLIAFVCFFIHADGIDSRFGLSVGSLFAVVGNKYIIDSALPETTSFTLVDTLHGLTLFVIFIVISATAVSLRLIKQDKIKQARRFDNVVAAIIFLLYFLANIWFIYAAIKTVDGN
ncbi:MAG: hypothetical protein IPL54_04510 [Chitinophagaceae bacterium]|nr:hypothetical protein [Chitinophagaceae bacterium]